MLRWLIAFVFLTLPAAAEEVVLGLSQDEVAITTSFNGSEILIFGAVKRETPIPEGDPLQVVITVAGPTETVTVRRKEKKFGIWVNTDTVEIDQAPSFYAVSSSAVLQDIITDTEDLRYRISIPRVIRSIGAAAQTEEAAAFSQAVMRIRSASDQYQALDNNVQVDAQTLFQTSVRLPAALTAGKYTTRIFLVRKGRIVSSYQTGIDVKKVGLERWLYTLSRENAFLYGLMSLAIAIAAGWGASAVFRMFRP